MVPTPSETTGFLTRTHLFLRFQGCLTSVDFPSRAPPRLSHPWWFELAGVLFTWFSVSLEIHAPPELHLLQTNGCMKNLGESRLQQIRPPLTPHFHPQPICFEALLSNAFASCLASTGAVVDFEPLFHLTALASI